MTSTGLCTPTAILDAEINRANPQIMAMINFRLWIKLIIVASIAAPKAWPEGKEKLSGQGIKVLTPVCQQVRGTAIPSLIISPASLKRLNAKTAIIILRQFFLPSNIKIKIKTNISAVNPVNSAKLLQNIFIFKPPFQI